MTVAHDTQIQEKRIGACCRHIKTPGVKHLILGYFLSALGGGHLRHNTLIQVSLILLHQVDALVCRIVIRQTILMPQQTVAFAGIYKRNRYLTIHLGEPATDPIQVKLSVLKLAQTKNNFVGTGVKSLFNKECWRSL